MSKSVSDNCFPSIPSVLTFRQQLVKIGSADGDDDVMVLNPFSHTWLKIGSIPMTYITASVVLATEEIVVVVEVNYSELSVLKASWKCK